MKTTIAVLVLLGSAFALSGSNGNRGYSHQKPKHAKLCCPVTRLPIGSPSEAVARSVYKGRTYYFCTDQCKRMFDAHPAKYSK